VVPGTVPCGGVKVVVVLPAEQQLQPSIPRRIQWPFDARDWRNFFKKRNGAPEKEMLQVSTQSLTIIIRKKLFR
jgi:hypothetical protein